MKTFASMLRKIGSRMIEIILTFLFLRGKTFCVPEFLKSPRYPLITICTVASFLHFGKRLTASRSTRKAILDRMWLLHGRALIASQYENNAFSCQRGQIPTLEEYFHSDRTFYSFLSSSYLTC